MPRHPVGTRGDGERCGGLVLVLPLPSTASKLENLPPACRDKGLWGAVRGPCACPALAFDMTALLEKCHIRHVEKRL
jgi:hypothetical protein